MFIVLDTFDPEQINVVTNEEGNTVYLPTKEKAQEILRELQAGQIVELSPGKKQMRVIYYESGKWGIFWEDGQIVIDYRKSRFNFVLTYGDLETKKRYGVKDLNFAAPETKKGLTPILKTDAPKLPEYLKHKLMVFALEILKYGTGYIETLPRVEGAV